MMKTCFPMICICCFSLRKASREREETEGSFQRSASRCSQVLGWWFRNTTNSPAQLSLIVYPMIYTVLYLPSGCLGFPSTVWTSRFDDFLKLDHLIQRSSPLGKNSSWWRPKQNAVRWLFLRVGQFRKLLDTGMPLQKWCGSWKWWFPNEIFS